MKIWSVILMRSVNINSHEESSVSNVICTLKKSFSYRPFRVLVRAFKLC